MSRENLQVRPGAWWLAPLCVNLAGLGACQTVAAQPVNLTGDYAWTALDGTPPPDPTSELVVDDLTVGVNGQGGLIVQSGGQVSVAGNGILAHGSGSQGDATVTGSGSTWDTFGNFTVGDGGRATLTIENGGLVSNVGASIAAQGGSQGAVTVTGSGSQWSTGKLQVGAGGNGSLSITDGGWVTTFGDSIVGDGAGSTGTVTVSHSGAGGWLVEGDGNSTTNGKAGNLTVGGSGTGILNIQDGGAVQSVSGTSTVGGGGQGTVTVTGSASRWDTRSLNVGDYGTGTVTVSDGGTLNSGTARLGNQAGSTGTVTITGAGSSWNRGTGADLYVGHAGNGILKIQDEAVIASRDTVLGYARGSTGAATVTGNGQASGGATTMWVANTFQVGASGAGQLTVENGGYVQAAGDINAGVESGSTGTVTVTGAGSGLDSQSGGLQVGVRGTGILNIEDGAQVVTAGGDSTIGAADGSVGTVTVSGRLSRWDADRQTIAIGLYGHGTLNIQDGGSVVSRFASLGGSGDINSRADTRGDATVTGAGSLWQAETLSIGRVGQGTLTVADGGTVQIGTIDIGLFGHDTGTINLNGTDGARGVLETAYIVTIGGEGQINFDGGVLRVADNATGSIVDGAPEAPLGVNILAGGAFIDTNGRDISVDVGMGGEGGLTKLGDGTLTLSGGNGYRGVTQVEQGTLLWGGNLNSGGFVQNTPYVINGGTLDFGANHGNSRDPLHFDLTMSSLSGSGGTVKMNLGSLIVNQSVDTTYAGSITGAGGLTKQGTGTLTLAGDSTYTGATVVSGGTLAVNGSIASNVTVRGSGTLGGTGVVAADVANGGTVAPGNSIGTLAVSGGFTQSEDGVLQVETDFARGRSDRLDVGGDAALAGRVEIHAASVLPGVRLPFLTVGGTLSHSLSAPSSIFDYAIGQAGNQLSVEAASAHFGEPGFALGKDQGKVASHLQKVWDAGGASFGTLFGTLGTLADGKPGGYAAALSDLSPGVAGAAAAGSIATTQQHLDLLLSCPMFADGTSFLTETSCTWAQTGVQRLDQKAGGGVSGFDTKTYSLQAGTQVEVSPGWFVGVAGGYDRSLTRGDDGRVDADGDIGYLGASLKRQAGPWLLSGALAGSYGWYDSKRTVRIPGFTGQAKGDPDIYNLSARVRAAYTFAQDAYYVRPLVDLDLIYSHANGYRESGAGMLDLVVEDAGQWIFRATPALEVGTRVALTGRTTLRAFAAAGVSFSSADNWKTTARLAQAPDGTGGFDSQVRIADVVGRLTAGVDLANDGGLSLRMAYQGAFSDTYTSHGGSLRLSYRF